MDLLSLIFGYVLGLVIGVVCSYLAVTSTNQLNVRDERLKRINEGVCDDKKRIC
jgi:hypothetical protein